MMGTGIVLAQRAHNLVVFLAVHVFHFFFVLLTELSTVAIKQCLHTGAACAKLEIISLKVHW